MRVEIGHVEVGEWVTLPPLSVGQSVVLGADGALYFDGPFPFPVEGVREALQAGNPDLASIIQAGRRAVATSLAKMVPPPTKTQ